MRLAELPQDTERVTTLVDLGERLAYTDYKESLELYAEAKPLANALNFQPGIARLSAAMAELYQYLGVQDIAMEFALDALTRFSELRDTMGMARATISIGLIHSELKQYASAKERYVEAEALYEVAGGKRGVFAARHNYAVVLADEGDTLRADSLYRANLSKLQGSRYSDAIAATYNNLGNLMDRRTQSDSALRYYNWALTYKRKAGRAGPLANTMINMAEVLVYQGKYVEARRMLDSAQFYIHDTGSNELHRDYHRQMAALMKATGNPAAAVTHLEEMVRLQDSLYDQSSTEQAQRMEAAFANKEKESQIALLNQQAAFEQAESARLWWFNTALAIALALTVVLLTVGFFRGRERMRVNKLLRKKNAEIQRQQAEIILQNQQLAAQNRRLEEYNREKDGLIGVVAHDLRAPLNRSAALAELVQSSGALNEEQEKYLEMIRKVNDDGGRLIQDLLEMNSYENEDFKIEHIPVNLSELLERSVRGFEKAASDKSIHLHVELPSMPVEADTDEKLLSRVLDNLLSNAIKFTKPGKNVYIGLQRENGHAEVIVRDEGLGISEDDQKKMFRKFQRLSARPTAGESSTGLGLSIVKTLVERLHGEIDLQSTVGTGTEFRIKLPRH